MFIVSFHKQWTIYAILSTFAFDVVGGGDLTRMIMSITCIAAISPPAELYS